MEKEYDIDTTDKKIIKGILNSKNNNRLIVFVHGLAGERNEHIFYNAVPFFNNNGFDTFRFNLYDSNEKCRSLIDCCISIHAVDIDKVITFFNEKYSEIHIIGHSLGGPSILWSNLELIKSIVLWDPTINIAEIMKNEFKFNEKLDCYILKWGVEFLLSKKMVEEWSQLDKRIVRLIKKPTKIICAGNGILYDQWMKYIDLIEVKNEFKIIENVTHNFDENGKEKELFEETLKWLK